MARKKVGKRHALIMYRQLWTQICRMSLILGILLGVLWWQADSAKIPLIVTARSLWVLAGAVVLTAIGILAFFARYLNYVQARESYVRLVTPLLRFNISYQRIKNVRSASLGNLFPASQQSWGQRQFLHSFYGLTTVTIGVKGYPINPTLLKLFLPKYLFIPGSQGFVFLVSDWMALSTEIDTLIAEWQESKRKRTRRTNSPYQLQ